MKTPGLILIGDRISELADLARLADEAGFDSVWTTEFYNRHGFVALGAVAAATKRVRLGTGIAYAYMRSPVLTAAAAMDVDEISGGRVVLGLGSGTRSMNESWYGVPFEPRSAPKMRECVRLLRTLFETTGGGPVELDGEFYRIRIPLYGRAHAARETIPVDLAGVQKGMLRSAGEVADGLVGHPIYTRRYVEEFVWPNLAIGFERGGRRREDFEAAGYVITSISDDRAEAIREAKGQIAFYATAKSYAGIFALHGWEEAWKAISAAFKTFDFGRMAACVSDEMVEQIALVGTAEECRDKLRQWEGLLDRPLLYPPSVGVAPERVAENSRRIIETFAS